MIIWQFPYVKNLLDRGILEGMPGWITKGAEGQKRFPVYFAYNWFDKNLEQFLGILAILLAMGAIAREVEAHTLEFLLARPISRKRLLLEKVLTHLLAILLISVVTSIILGLTGIALDYPVDFTRLLISNFITFGKIFVVYSLTLLVSLFLDDQVKTGIFSFLIIILIVTTSFIDFLRFLNIFAYSAATPYYVQGLFPWKGFILTYLVGLVLLGLSFVKFEKRDF